MDDRAALVYQYFKRGYTFLQMQVVLSTNHDIILSVSQIKRVAAKLDLYRKGHHSNLEDIVDFISNEVQRSGQQHGYRFMHAKCLAAGLKVSQKVVADAVKLIDPEGVDLRKRRRLIRRRYYAKGPNSVWHIDSYDKLKPYGICINAAIDGFSRKIIWAAADTTNSDPSLIATYYTDAVQSLNGCPEKIRVDAGTENTTTNKLQEFFTDNASSVIIGVSTSNVRIESWWGQYRKGNAEYFIAMFHQLANDGDYTGNFIDKELLRFCFLSVIQCELTAFVDLWNHHVIRRTTNDTMPSGRPSFMYECPEAYGTDNHLCLVDDEFIEASKEVCKVRSGLPCDEDFFELCTEVMMDCQLESPENSDEALILYKTLRPDILQLL